MPDPTPTAIRLAIEERRADFAVALADLHNQAARRAVQTTEAEIEAHRATLDLLAKAGADPGGRAPFDFDERMNEEAAAYAKMRMAWQDATGCPTPDEARAKRERWTEVSRANLATIDDLRAQLDAEQESHRLAKSKLAAEDAAADLMRAGLAVLGRVP